MVLFEQEEFELHGMDAQAFGWASMARHWDWQGMRIGDTWFGSQNTPELSGKKRRTQKNPEN